MVIAERGVAASTVNGAAPSGRANGTQAQLFRERRHESKRGRQCRRPRLITEILMSLSRRGSIIAALFPKEQVPASTPIPPREVGTIFL
jgi:hypothetical protein